jgi:hypothetical protein
MQVRYQAALRPVNLGGLKTGSLIFIHSWLIVKGQAKKEQDIFRGGINRHSGKKDTGRVLCFK